VNQWVTWAILGAVLAGLAVAWLVVPPIVFKSAARELWALDTAKATTKPSESLRKGMTFADATKVMGEPAFTQRNLQSQSSSGVPKAIAAIASWGAAGSETRALFIDDRLLDARTGTWPPPGN